MLNFTNIYFFINGDETSLIIIRCNKHMLSAGLHDKIQKPKKETINFYFLEMVKSTNIVETNELFF
jgi:hypothetical protein